MNEHKRSTQTKQTKIMQIPPMTTYILLHGLKNIPVSIWTHKFTNYSNTKYFNCRVSTLFSYSSFNSPLVVSLEVGSPSVLVGDGGGVSSSLSGKAVKIPSSFM